MKGFLRSIATSLVILPLILAGCADKGSSQFERSKASLSGKKDQNAGEELAITAQRGKGEDAVDGGKGQIDPDENEVIDVIDNPGKDEDVGGTDEGEADADYDDEEGDDDEDLPTKGGKNPAQMPSQSPSQNPINPKEDVVVDLPKKACYYNDPEHPAFLITKHQFGPNLPPLDVPSTIMNGGIQDDGKTYIGTFKVFEMHRGRGDFSFDGHAGYIPYVFTLVVVDAEDDGCTAYLEVVMHDPRGNSGCFDPNTRIRMADGKDQVIALLNKSDKVYNPVLRQAMTVAEVVRGPEAKPLWEIGFDGRKVRMTEDHPVPTKAGLKRAMEVTKADEILDADGKYHKVTLVEKLPVKAGQEVINLRLATDSTAPEAHMVLSDGIVTGDLFLQRQLTPKQVAGK